MSGTVSTQAQLLAEFADGQPAAAITPVRMRDMVATLFSFLLCPTSSKTAAYTFAVTDAGLCIEYNSSAAGTFTIPPFSTAPLPVGAVISACQIGSGQLAVIGGSGVTLSAPVGGAIATRAPWSTLILRCRAQNSWVASGDLA